MRGDAVNLSLQATKTEAVQVMVRIDSVTASLIGAFLDAHDIPRHAFVKQGRIVHYEYPGGPLKVAVIEPAPEQLEVLEMCDRIRKYADAIERKEKS
jgi:hypothetical protein